MAQILPVPHPINPYWLSEPHRLAEFRSTPNLPPACDVVIIGSGMAGITTAYHLLRQSERRPDIVILEARQLCSGATGRNGGHSKIKVATLASLITKLGHTIADELQAYVLRIIDGLKQVVEEEELDCEFELRRSFDVQTDAEESRRMKEIYEESRKRGQKWTKHVDFVDGRTVEQITSIKGATSAFSSAVCSFWPYKFVSQLLARLLDRFPQNLNFQTTTPVTAVMADQGGSNLVQTPRGTIRAKKVVFATNAYTAGLLPQFHDIITPVKGMASHLVPKNPVHPHLSNTYNIDFGPGKGTDYLNPRPDSSIVVGGAKWEFESERESWLGNFDDSVPFPKKVEEYWEGYMQRTFQGWEDSGAEVERVWVGIMGNTPDGWPHVGRVPMARNQWLLAGFNGGGMAMILTAAKAIARMVEEDAEFEDVAEKLGVPAFFGTSKERLRG